MGKVTLFFLWLIGWRWYTGKDGNGREYVGFTRRHWLKGNWSYFHVYHENCRGETIRPVFKDRPQKEG